MAQLAAYADVTDDASSADFEMWTARSLASFALTCAVLFAALWSDPASAQARFPERPVRLIVAVAPGGGMDLTARVLAARLSSGLGQSVVVENKAGASGLIAYEHVASSPADGHTLLFMGNSQSITEALARVQNRKVPFDTARDFTPVTLFADSPFVLAVRSDHPWRSAADLVAAAKAKPGAITYVSSGPGRTDHMAGALFAAAAGIEMLHVPYKGLGPGLQAIIAGQTDTVFGALPAVMPHVNSGRLKILALVKGQRVALLPGVPTLAESLNLPGFEVTSWIGVLAPKGTPPAVIQRLNQEIVKLVRDPDFEKTALRAGGLEPVGSPPERLAEVMRQDYARYIKIFTDHPALRGD